MPFRLAIVLIAVSLSLTAQMRMTVAQLKSFVQSEIELKEPDSKLGAYLKKVKLSDRLDDRIIQQMQSMGAGPKTLAALRELRDLSAKLPAAEVAAPESASEALPPPSTAEQKQVLAEATNYALNFTSQLPDFICTQVTRRYIDPTGTGFRLVDTIVEKLTYFDHKEDYKVVLVNDKPRDIQHQDLRGSAISSGEFGSMMREIFEPETQTRFEWEKWTTLRGRFSQIFSYRVQQPLSKYRIEVPDRHLDTIVGYHGVVYVDNQTHMIVRITLVADDIPASFPMQRLSEDLNYSYQTIGGRQFLLPFVAEVHSQQARTLIKNQVEFHSYRKFGVEANINFETPAPVSDDQLKEQPASQK